MNLKLDIIDIILLSFIYGGLILLPIVYRKKPFPWKAVLDGILISFVTMILVNFFHFILFKLTGKSLGKTKFDPFSFFFVIVPLFVLISLYLSYKGKSLFLLNKSSKDQPPEK